MGSLSGKNAVVTGSTSGIGLAYARAFAGAGANVVINGFGSPEDIEKERAKIESDFGVKAVYSPADMTKPAEIAGMIALGEKSVRLGRHPRQQCRHPVRLADRGIPDREVGPDHRDQPVLGLPRHPRGRPRHEEEGLGPHHQHRLGALAGRLALQVGLRVGQARHRRPDQDRGAGGRDLRITCNCISPGYVWTPLVEKQIPDTMKARNLTREQVINDVLLDAQPTKEFVTVRAGRRARAVPVRRRCRADHRHQPLDRRRLDRGVAALDAEGWAKARQRRAHHACLSIEEEWWARFALPTLRVSATSRFRPSQWLHARAVTIADDRFNSANMILPATTTRTLASARRSTVSGTRVAL